MTSALPAEQSPNVTLTVAEIRRCLAVLRRSWESTHCQPEKGDSAGNLFFPSRALTVVQGMTFAQFALQFIMEHHARRGVRRAKNEAKPLSKALRA